MQTTILATKRWMMKKPNDSRKVRADSKEEAVRTFIAANKVVEPPKGMDFTKEQRVIFDEVIAEFAKIDWSDHSIRLAALLARSIDMLDDAQTALADEGLTSMSQRGTPCINPNLSASNMLSGQIMSLRRTLALHATAGSSKADTGKRRGIHKSQENDSPLTDDPDNLINTPSPMGSA